MFKLLKLIKIKEDKQKPNSNFEEEDYILDFKPFDENLKEDLKEDDLENEIKKLKLELEKLNDKLEKLNDKEGDSQDIANFTNLYFKISRIKDTINKLEKRKKYSEKEDLATEEDWDELLSSLPEEFHFEDLEIEVESEPHSEPVGWNYKTDSIVYRDYPAQQGYVNEWNYIIYPSKELVARMLNKKVEEITKKDLVSFDETDYSDFIYNDPECIKKVTKDAENNWEYDDVDWVEPEEPDYD